MGEAKPGAFFQSLASGLTRSPERSTGKHLRPLELVKDLMLAFLKGPMAIVVSDATTEVVEASVVHKAASGDDLTLDELSALQRGIENLHGSALYPLGYKFIYHTLDELAEGQRIDRQDDLPIYPPSDELFKITERMIELRCQLIPIEELIHRGLGNPRLLGDPQYQSDLKHAVESSDPYQEFRGKSKDLTRTVIGSAATDFLFKALESIPQVEPYLLQVMEAVDHDSAVVGRDYVKMLLEAPPYVRALCYVSEMNDNGHHIRGARIPVPVSTSEMTQDEFNGMLSRLFGAQANSNPFHSTQRALFYTRHPLKVEQQYEEWRATRGLPPPGDPKDAASTEGG
ncbi:MAG: hypothetical protein GY856_54565 [bacterium]|nr:hypothetical protein [bacterium]